MGMRMRGGAVLVGVLVTATTLTGCAGGGTATAEAPSPSATEATPGRASCDLTSGGGSVSLEETADAYRVEWSGVPTSAEGARQEYQLYLGDESQEHAISMYIGFDSITRKTTYGWFNRDTNDVDPIPGTPDTSAGTVVGTIPKQTEIDAVYWSPSYSRTTTDDSSTTWCTEDSQVMPWTPLD